MNLALIGRNSSWSRESLLALTVTLVLTTVFVILVSLSGGKTPIIAAFPLLAILLFVISSFELALAALVTSLFVDYHISAFSSAVWFSLPFGLAFLLKHRSIEWKEFTNPMTVPILVYGACILPSFLNATKPLLSLVMLFNVAAFLIVLYALVAALRSHDDLRRVVTVFLVMVLVNSIHVFIQSLAGNARPFGFAGIMFVDYSALALCLALAMSLLSRGKQRTLLLLISLIIIAALLLTQTRNTLVSAVITLTVMIIYLMFHPEIARLSRKRLLVLTVFGMLGLAGAGALVVSLNPKIEKRAIELTDKPGFGIDETGRIETSVGTRLLIWDTAINAFRAHPMIGIGVYAFPYSSHQYYTIPKTLYKEIVAQLSPHQTHLAVLAETGLIGFVGFLIFIVTALRHASRAIKLAKDERGKRYAMVGAIALVYCTVSMVFTDAWLWGQEIVLLGLVMGAVLANRRLVTSTDEQVRG